MSKPVKIILDTDMGPDCDDAAALAVLHALADRGEAEIAGITHCTSSPWGAGCIDAINRYYGRPDIRIGTLQEPGFLDGQPYQKYDRHIGETYPNAYAEGKQPEEAVALLRELLASEPDGSIVIVAIGPLPNLSGLLHSGPDAISPLSGVELAARKVAELVVMGGAFPAGAEWNFQMDAVSARHVAGHWPTPIMFSGYEIGSEIMTGGRLFRETPPHNPVREAYRLFVGEGGSRSSWDLTAVLYGVRGLAGHWQASPNGRIEVADDGENKWTTAPDRNRRYLLPAMDSSGIQDVLEELLVKPPILK
ncbi:nucleoside hydrolase [Paenibacillus piri]|uniref:Nucleoside hydrolase n=1 Tax=Paenibacillus piri TaxID=2547395 RepID=A0A4R5KVZ3_9BACL|nr:nucleoside hydrolase [Paenibacillus piri]TDG00154.1 nucleoside hydrolase [Paenibacillus piri]